MLVSAAAAGSYSASKHDIPKAQVDRQVALFDAKQVCLQTRLT